MTQQPPEALPCAAYGSSFLLTGPHTDGTRVSFVFLQCRIKLALASLIRMRGRERSSRRRWLCSISRRSFSSDMLCFARELMVSKSTEMKR